MKTPLFATCTVAALLLLADTLFSLDLLRGDHIAPTAFFLFVVYLVLVLLARLERAQPRPDRSERT